MTTNALWVKIDAERVIETLEGSIEKLEVAGGELALDFSSVRRIDPAAIKTLEKLAALAEGKTVKVVLCGVPIDVYRVLKLVKLAPRFSFLT